MPSGTFFIYGTQELIIQQTGCSGEALLDSMTKVMHFLSIQVCSNSNQNKT